MFIELTDQLRCPAEHDESFLVLIPDRTEQRAVVEGLLGCPVCQREYRISGGVVRFGEPGPATISTPDPAMAEALVTFTGLEGPGGYLGVIGEAAGLAPALGQRLPGVHVAAVNPPAGLRPSAAVSLLQSPRLPFKQRSLRSLILSQPMAADPAWQEAAIAAVLPGLRIVGTGKAPASARLELLAEASGWWVGTSSRS
jgi:uncharacterized protein YbaR (Trm112 family)